MILHSRWTGSLHVRWKRLNRRTWGDYQSVRCIVFVQLQRLKNRFLVDFYRAFLCVCVGVCVDLSRCEIAWDRSGRTRQFSLTLPKCGASAHKSTVLVVLIIRCNKQTSCVFGEGTRERERANLPLACLIFLQVMGSASADVAAGTKRKSPEPSSTSSSSRGINHDVFLSFRGQDTRDGFTDLLYRDLKNARIEVFRDDKSLRGGEEITQALKDAIKRSRISIAIFSKDYASSKSCLMELAQMWECRESNKQIIIPIFYDVTPDDVKNQAGAFATSFEKHVNDGVNEETIETWKNVLRLVGKLVGFERKNINCGKVTDLLEEVVKRVCQVLRKDDQAVTNKLVGIDPHVQDVMTKLGVVYSHGEATRVCGEDVRVVGICGIRGVGKTTLAKLVYNKMHKLFDGRCSFVEVENLRGVSDRKEILKGVKPSQELLIAGLQKEDREQLMSYDKGMAKIASLFNNMKVLIVLDGVHKVEQIEGLAGKVVKWFGPGSRIIVTTDTKEVLKGFDFGDDKDRAAEEYELKPMGDGHALQLFRKHAFPGYATPDDPDYVSLSREIIKVLGGIPMAIVSQANYLKDVRIESWASNLTYLKQEGQEDIVEAALRASYNSLKDRTKEIFLDIACFFIGKDKRIPRYMWEAYWVCDPLREIKRLCDMHFLEVGENNELRMHNSIRDFGRKLINDKDRRKRCRYWNHRHALPFAEDLEGTASVEGIGLTVEEGCTDSFKCEQFWKMLNLRYLGLDRAKIEGDTTELPRDLRWLDWRECHSIPKLDNMKLEELVILDLSRSLVTKDSEFWTQIREKVKKLKVLNLQGCEKLHVSFNFPAPTKLEILILEDCTQLFNIGRFISELRNLRSLNLRNCSLVTKLPEELYSMEFLAELLVDGTGIKKIDCKEGSLKYLETLSARNCKHLQDISGIGRLRKLSSLALDGADIEGLPLSFEFPQKLERLSLRDCQKLVRLPTSIGKLELLEEMDLSETQISELPESVQKLRNLKTLKMTGTPLEEFPKEIMRLEKLEEIDFSGCTNLVGGSRHCYNSGLSSLRILRLSSSNVDGLPNSIHHLRTLDVGKCKELHELPELPSSLLSLSWGSKIMAAPRSTNLTNLKELCLIHDEQAEAGGSPNQTQQIGWITGLTSLETLEVSLPNVTYFPENLTALTQLRELTLSHMKDLDLARLPSSSSLLTLRLKRCKIQAPKFSGLQLLSELELEDCDLAEIHDLEKLELLEVLTVTDCKGVTNLDGIKNLRRLRKVKVYPFVFDPATLSELRKRGCEVDTAALLS